MSRGNGAEQSSSYIPGDEQHSGVLEEFNDLGLVKLLGEPWEATMDMGKGRGLFPRYAREGRGSKLVGVDHTSHPQTHCGEGREVVKTSDERNI